MKYSLAVIFFLLFFFLRINAQNTNSPAKSIVEEACRQAAKENKKVFIIFHASWCGWCRTMDTILNRQQVKPLFDAKYVTRHIVVLESSARKNLETPGGKELLDRHVPNYGGIPAWVILDTTGNALADSRLRKPGTDSIGINTGCPATREEIDYFITCLKNTSALTQPELLVIARAFGKIREISYE